jgi:hypothetical protein
MFLLETGLVYIPRAFALTCQMRGEWNISRAVFKIYNVIIPVWQNGVIEEMQQF